MYNMFLGFRAATRVGAISTAPPRRLTRRGRTRRHGTPTHAGSRHHGRPRAGRRVPREPRRCRRDRRLEHAARWLRSRRRPVRHRRWRGRAARSRGLYACSAGRRVPAVPGTAPRLLALAPRACGPPRARRASPPVAALLYPGHVRPRHLRRPTRRVHAGARPRARSRSCRSLPERLRNGDAYHAFRQHSDVFYLTGFVEPDTTLVLRPGAETERVVMFVRPRDPEMRDVGRPARRPRGREGALRRRRRLPDRRAARPGCGELIAQHRRAALQPRPRRRHGPA